MTAGDLNRKESNRDGRGNLRVRVRRFPVVKEVRVRTQDERAGLDSGLEARNCG